MTHLVDKIFMRSHTIKFLKYGIFFTMKTVQSCIQAVAKTLQHATLKCQSNKEKCILYCLLRLIRYYEKVIRVQGAFFEAVNIKLG